MGVDVDLGAAVKRRPLWLVLEKTHRLDILFLSAYSCLSGRER
jgi:hypothetical protein